MSEITHPTRIRRSLISIDGTDERKGFFYCLKLLGVLPPPKGSDFGSWKYTTRAKVANYRPKCLHDVLIGNHATSCEHTTVYFGFYHRHLMILTEIFLNFGHQILKGGFAALGQSYPPSDKFKNVEPFASIHGFKFNSSIEFDFLYQGKNIANWTQVFVEYQKLQGIPEQIACHYWAPTNFLQNADLTMPPQLAAKSYSNDSMDVLFQGINKSYPWEINVERRWCNDPSQFKKENIQFRGQLIQGTNIPKTPQAYTSNQLDFLNGKLDPRLNPLIYAEVDNGLTIPGPKFLIGYLKKNNQMVAYRSYQLFDEKNNFRLNAIQQKQSIANYGGKKVNLQYLTDAEKKKLEDNNCGGAWMEAYNMQIPHYQYANALFHGMKQFIQGSKSIQISHNFIHNNFQDILRDSRASLTSLLFYSYHSWIDAMLEFKLRIGNGEKTQNNQRPGYDYFHLMLNDKYTKIQQRYRGRLNAQFTQVSVKTAPMSKWFLSGDNEIGADTAGRYPILEWYDTVENISIAFCARDYILTKTDIRDSQHFNEIYQFQKYKQLFSSRYAFYKNLDKFNYNYNYQIGSSPADKNNLLKKFAENLPQYLIDMRNDILAKDQPKQKSLKAAVALSKKIHKYQELHEGGDQIQLDVRKTFLGNVELFASYPPNIKNGINPVMIKLKKLFKSLAKNLNEHELQQLEGYVFHGFQASDIIIFGKQQAAQDCPRCRDNKGKFLELDDDIRVRIPRIWKQIHLASLNQVLYDSNHPQKAPKCIYQKLDLVPNPTFTDYRFIRGAEEIFVNVRSHILTKEAKFIRLDTESFSVRTDTVKIVVSKKHQSFNTNFDFYKLFDVDNENERNYFDRYVYKQIRGWISVGSERVKFQFSIPSFQRVLRLTLNINRENDKLHVQIVDTDYHIKHAYYEAYSA